MAKTCPSCSAPLENEVHANAVRCPSCKAIYCWWCDQTISKESLTLHYNTTGKGCRQAAKSMSSSSMSSPSSQKSKAADKKVPICMLLSIWLTYMWRVIGTPIALLCVLCTSLASRLAWWCRRNSAPLDDIDFEKDMKPSKVAEVHPVVVMETPPQSTHVIHKSAYSMYANL
ncbi:hypothetical protein LEN26_007415 [Aphanomyces euteiches]|nr:hypothetical protein AeMF1_019020 [Aphanomyces euteiches]KAH9132458.1 hypothetical protein LEN26_007415 [Aphanomyces euteiches]KAH9192829.1 hypothetical protein AeNC1_005186 [Aphanomyces euteiches]